MKSIKSERFINYTDNNYREGIVKPGNSVVVGHAKESMLPDNKRNNNSRSFKIDDSKSEISLG
jgi:hypothetical protein